MDGAATGDTRPPWAVFAQALLGLAMAAGVNLATGGKSPALTWTLTIAATIASAVVALVGARPPSASAAPDGVGIEVLLLLPAVSLAVGFLFRVALIGTAFVREDAELVVWFAAASALVGAFAAVLTGYRFSQLGVASAGAVPLATRLLLFACALALTGGAWFGNALLFRQDLSIAQGPVESAQRSAQRASEAVQDCDTGRAAAANEVAQAQAAYFEEVQGSDGQPPGNGPEAQRLQLVVEEARQRLAAIEDECAELRSEQAEAEESVAAAERALPDDDGTGLPVEIVSAVLLGSIAVGSELAFSLQRQRLSRARAAAASGT